MEKGTDVVNRLPLHSFTLQFPHLIFYVIHLMFNACMCVHTRSNNPRCEILLLHFTIRTCLWRHESTETGPLFLLHLLVRCSVQP